MDPLDHQPLDRRSQAAEFSLERPDTPDATALIDELERHLASRYPAESRHGYSVEKLIREGVVFFVARIGTTPVGCGGIQLYGREYGELKRMYVPPTPPRTASRCYDWKRGFTKPKPSASTRGSGSGAARRFLPIARIR